MGRAQTRVLRRKTPFFCAKKPGFALQKGHKKSFRASARNTIHRAHKKSTPPPLVRPRGELQRGMKPGKVRALPGGFFPRCWRVLAANILRRGRVCGSSTIAIAIANPPPCARGPGASAPTAGQGLWVLVFAGACQGTAWAGLCLIHHHHHNRNRVPVAAVRGRVSVWVAG